MNQLRKNKLTASLALELDLFDKHAQFKYIKNANNCQYKQGQGNQCQTLSILRKL